MLKELPSAVCEEAFPDDPDFPQLKVAADPAIMLEVFRAHLKPIAGKDVQIRDCIPFRFRCRQSSSRCVLQYTLRIAEPSHHREWNQWVTGLIYAHAEAAERLWREIGAVDPEQEIPEGWRSFEPICFIPSLQMLVQVFPYDRKLPTLCRVMTGASRFLDPLLLSRQGTYGQWHVENRTILPTRYRTELGAALKYTMRAREALAEKSETLRCYLKVYRNDHGQETYRLLQSLAEMAEAGEKVYSVVRPIAYLSEVRMLVIEEAAGTTLQQMLLEGHDSTAVARPVARAVAAFNQDELRITRQHALAKQSADVKRASSLVQWACPRVREEAKAITAAVVAGLEEVPPAPIHRDLKPDHIFLEGDRVNFIDLDSVALGDPVRDPAHLFAHLAARVGLDSMPREQARKAAAAFVEEYFACVPKSWRKNFTIHCAGAFIEVAGGIFKRQEAEWPERVAACIEEAQQALSGGFR